MRLPGHGRYPHSALPRRATYAWPNGARLAVVICNNIEHFAYRAGLGSDSAQAGAAQNQRNYAWRDYGNRVGLWYLLDLLDDLALPCAHNVNGAVLDHCPEIAPALLARGDELIGHGRTNAERQDVLFEEDERRLIRDSRDAILRHGGTPRGWLGPYIAQSPVTLDLLKEEGFTYVMDPRRPDPQRPLLDRDQRQPGAGLPPARRPRLRRHDRGPVRRAAAPVR